MTKEQKIEMLEKMGARRWQKGNMDRLYINADVLGYEYTKYKSGNIHTATLNGKSISNSEMYRVLGYKTYLDINADFKMVTNTANAEYIDAVNNFISQIS